MKHLLKTFLPVLVFFVLFASRVNAQTPSSFDCSGGFSALFPSTNSITYKEVTFSTPTRIVAHIVKINLSDKNIYYTTTPRQYLGNPTSVFLQNIGADLAINGSGFVTLSDPLGLNSYRGDIYSSAKTSGILASIDKSDNTVDILQGPPGSIWSVVSGVNDLVLGGQIADKVSTCSNSQCTATGCGGTGSSATYCNFRPRTLMGINSNNLILVAIDGDGANNSAGASFLVSAQILKQCGATTGMNMDGGGSTTMVATSPNVTGRQYINTLASGERIVSNHFGVCIGHPCKIVNPSYTSPLPQGEARPRYTSANPYPFPCDQTAPYASFIGVSGNIGHDNEFHSLRPYQGSPCNQNLEDLALFCGNDLFVTQTVSVIKNFNGGPPNAPSYSVDGKAVQPAPPSSSTFGPPCRICTGYYQCSDSQWGHCDPTQNECEVDAECSNCQVNHNGTETCSFTFTNTKDVAVDVTGAEFPIMGYTEPSVDANPSKPKVINAYNPSNETMDNSTKVNEYVSWYLNGVIGRAEYPYWDAGSNCTGASTKVAGVCSPTRVTLTGSLQCLNEWPIPFNYLLGPYYVPWVIPDGKEQCAGRSDYCCIQPNSSKFQGHTLMTDYSGPLKKLLPFTIQNTQKVAEINDAVSSVDQGTKIRHNQNVGCTITIPFFDVFGLNVGLFGAGMPAPCYRQWQLSDFGSIVSVLSDLSDILKRQWHLYDYKGNLPPLEENYLGQYYYDFVKDYKQWRGETCISVRTPIQIIGTVDICFNVSLANPAELGNLLSYIPMASTEDRLGDIRIKSAGVSPISVSPNFRIISVTVTNIQNANLFVPHMQETYDLSTLLQKTYSYKDAPLDQMPSSGFIPASPYCSYHTVRTNPGDDLFAGELKATINYTAQVFCTYYIWGDGRDPDAPYGNLCEHLVSGTCLADVGQYCALNYGQYDCQPGRICAVGSCSNPGTSQSLCDAEGGVCVPKDANCSGGSGTWPAGDYHCWNDPNFKCAPSDVTCTSSFTAPPQTQSCTNQILVNVKLETRTPLANEVWAKLVVGATGVFRKMLPQFGKGDTIEGVYDMPASSQVGYRDLSGGTVYAGDPTTQTPGSRAQIYFPHIGGIKEYFLTGIQALLRPKGFGTQPEFCSGKDCVEGNIIPSVSGGGITYNGGFPDICSWKCNPNPLAGVDANLRNRVYANFLAIANGIPGNPRINMFDTVWNSAINAGMDPVFAISIWLNETGASNYQLYCAINYSQVPDFGAIVNVPQTQISCPGGGITTDHFMNQLSWFLGSPWEFYNRCVGSGTYNCMLENWAYNFAYGFGCGPSTEGNNYIITIRSEKYEKLAPGRDFPCYPVSLP